MDEETWKLFIKSFIDGEKEQIITIDNKEYRLIYYSVDWVGDTVDIIDVQSGKYIGDLERDSYKPVGAYLRIMYEKDDTLPKIINTIKRYLKKEEEEEEAKKEKEKDKLNDFLYGDG